VVHDGDRPGMGTGVTAKNLSEFSERARGPARARGSMIFAPPPLKTRLAEVARKQKRPGLEPTFLGNYYLVLNNLFLFMVRFWKIVVSPPLSLRDSLLGC